MSKAEDMAVMQGVAQMVVLEETHKQRRRHLRATKRLQARLGKIDIPADELVRLGRERADRC